jgi:hypothetical protein
MILLLTTAALAAEPDWAALSSSDWKHVAERSSDVGTVHVYRKEIGELTCLRGVAMTDLTPQELNAVVVDVPSATKWSSANLTASKLLSSSGTTIELYQYMDVPNWTLVADRYWVLRGVTSPVGDGGLRYRWERLPAQTAHPSAHADAMGRSSGAIEPPINWGEWSFVPKDGRVEVTYRGCADVGGSLPDSIQRLVATRTLPDTVADLVLEAQRRK